jgi:hypothetical protein
MKYYKIRHIPTGWFFKPSKHGSKSNISKKGKVYQTKPSLKYLGDVYHHPAKTDESVSRAYAGYENRKVRLDEWEIVEFEVEEKE